MTGTNYEDLLDLPCLQVISDLNTQLSIIVKNSSPPPTVSRLSADRLPTVGKNTLLKPMSKPTTAYHQSRGLDKHEKKPSSEDQAFQKDVWIKM